MQYYIEFVADIDGGSYPYHMQSRYFDTQEEATEWVTENFDFIDLSVISIFLMSFDGADIDQVGKMDDYGHFKK